MAYKRIFGIVLDSVGIGAAPDAEKYGDVGSDTLGHIGAAFAGDWSTPVKNIVIMLTRSDRAMQTTSTSNSRQP